jgi:8-oxo-dGTP diphosphatase
LSTVQARKTTEVAVGVLLRPDGAVLLADRPEGKPYAGYWEFPGGKIEPGEDVQQALARELHEELGIEIGAALPWFVFEYDYPHAYVRLHFRRVFDWGGAPHSREGQRLAFVDPGGALPQPLLPAAIAPLRWLTLPAVCLRSAVHAHGHAAFIANLEMQLARGPALLLVDEPCLSQEEVRAVLDEALPRCRAHGAPILISSIHAALAPLVDGLLLSPADLASASARPAATWVGACIESATQFGNAARLGVDFCIAGPVLPSAEQPAAPTLGWHGFAALAAQAGMPVYAAGGLSAFDQQRAQHAGAHGVAVNAEYR